MSTIPPVIYLEQIGHHSPKIQETQETKRGMLSAYTRASSGTELKLSDWIGSLRSSSLRTQTGALARATTGLAGRSALAAGLSVDQCEEPTMPHLDFDLQPTLDSESLRLRPLAAEDLQGLYSAASDPKIWAGHPAKDRYKADVFEKYFRFLLGSGTALVIVDRADDRIIGCSRYYSSPDRPDDIAIGFTFLNSAYWGGETNFDVKRLMLEHAFKAYPEVWFHIDPTNLRSQKATAKLGAKHIYDADLDLSGAPALWMCFSLSESAWGEALQRRHPRP